MDAMDKHTHTQSEKKSKFANGTIKLHFVKK